MAGLPFSDLINIQEKEVERVNYQVLQHVLAYLSAANKTLKKCQPSPSLKRLKGTENTRAAE